MNKYEIMIRLILKLLTMDYMTLKPWSLTDYMDMEIIELTALLRT